MVTSAEATIVVRRVAAVPVRRIGDAWRVIAALLADSGTAAHEELMSIASPAGLLMAQEVTSTRPIVVTADTGPRIRIYTTHGESASDNANETELAAKPCSATAWQLRLPCDDADLADVLDLIAHASHVTAGDAPADEVASDSPSTGSNARDGFVIDRSQLE